MPDDVVALGLSMAIAFFLTRSLTRQIGTAVGHVQSSSAELQAAANQQATGAQGAGDRDDRDHHHDQRAAGHLAADRRERAARGADRRADGQRGAHRRRHRRRGPRVDRRHPAPGRSRSSATCSSSARSRSRSARSSTSSPSWPSRPTSSPSTPPSRRRARARRASASPWSPTRSASWPIASAARPRRSATLIDDVRGAVNTTVMATETGSKAVDAGARQFGEVAASFKQIAELVVTTHRGGARDRAVDQAAGDRRRAGQRRDRQRRAGRRARPRPARPDAADRVAAGGAVDAICCGSSQPREAA